MEVIILAQGEAARWQQSYASWKGQEEGPASLRIRRINNEVMPKHMLPIAEEPNLARTVRLVKKVGLPSPVVVAPAWYSEWLPPGTRVHTCVEPLCMACSILEVWPEEGPAVVLYGDVVWGWKTLSRLADDVLQSEAFPSMPIPSEWFGRLQPNAATGRGVPELYGFFVTTKERSRGLEMLADLCQRRKGGRYHPRYGMAWPWPMYRRFMGLSSQDPVERGCASGNLILVEDYTDDCDSLSEYLDYWFKLEQAALEDRC